MHPRVSVIIPTTHDRKYFNDAIFDQYMKQDYHNKELIWDWEYGTIGEKRNRCCEKARGEIILHKDSDDMYAPDWISKSVEALLTSGADITGLNPLNFYDLDNHAAYQYTYAMHSLSPMWLAGATLCYRKSFWEQNKFRDIQTSEDFLFVSKAKSIYNHRHIDSFLATIHSGNTSLRLVGNVINWRRLVGKEEQGIKDRWKL